MTVASRTEKSGFFKPVIDIRSKETDVRKDVRFFFLSSNFLNSPQPRIPVRRAEYYRGRSANRAKQRISMVAVSARVAGFLGLTVVFDVPLMIPAETAHLTAFRA